jgi:hypothetical protein
MRSQSRPMAALAVLLLVAIPAAAHLFLTGVPAFGRSPEQSTPHRPTVGFREFLARTIAAPAHVPAGVTPGLAPGLAPGLSADLVSVTRPRPPRPARPAAPSGTVWARLRACESGGNYAANTGNGYYGAYQFALGTWRSLGYGGLPHQAPPTVQDEAAQRLQARSGWRQWPACSRRLGLR